MRELPRGPHRRRDRRLRPPDARPLPAAGPGRPGEGRVELGHRLRRARPRTGRRGLRPLRAQAPPPPRAGGRRDARGGRRPRPSRPLPLRAAARRRRSRRSPARWCGAPATATRHARAGGSARRTRGTRWRRSCCTRAGACPRRRRSRSRTRRGSRSASGRCSVRARSPASPASRARCSPARCCSPRSSRPGRSPRGRPPAPAHDAALLPAAAPLDRIARAVCDAYVALGELRRRLPRRSSSSRAPPATCAAGCARGRRRSPAA